MLIHSRHIREEYVCVQRVVGSRGRSSVWHGISRGSGSDGCLSNGNLKPDDGIILLLLGNLGAGDDRR